MTTINQDSGSSGRYIKATTNVVGYLVQPHRAFNLNAQLINARLGAV